MDIAGPKKKKYARQISLNLMWDTPSQLTFSSCSYAGKRLFLATTMLAGML